MDVIVERFQRRKIVSNPASPMLYYLRQKPRPAAPWTSMSLPPPFRKTVP